MAERQDILAPAQPAFDELAQDAFAARRSVAAPVYDAQAALVGLQRFGEKARNRIVRLVAVEAMQPLPADVHAWR